MDSKSRRSINKTGWLRVLNRRVVLKYSPPYMYILCVQVIHALFAYAVTYDIQGESKPQSLAPGSFVNSAVQ